MLSSPNPADSALVRRTLIVLHLAGIILWWPDKPFRVNTTASWKRISLDLHHALGIVALIVLLVITSSATLIHFEGLAAAVKSPDAEPGPPRRRSRPAHRT